MGNMYAAEKYHQIFSDLKSIENIARGTWSTAKEYPGVADAGLRRYGASKLAEVMFL